MKNGNTHDLVRMTQALVCARKMQGKTKDNPCVGCLVEDKNKNIIAISATGLNGTPHAELTALNQAGNSAKDGTMYVTLEPCCHYGKTPPCVHRIIQSKIKRVVIGCLDTDKRVNGLGIKILLDSNIIVDVGILSQEILNHHKGYLLNRSLNRPQFVLKMALSVDAKSHNNQYNLQERCIISGQTSNLYVQHLRSRYDAIMVGSNTIRKDNPKLTCRIDFIGSNNKLINKKTTQVIILDTNLQLFKLHLEKQNINVFKQKQHKCIYVVYSDNSKNKIFVNEYLKNNNDKIIKFIPNKIRDKLLDLKSLASVLANNGINDVLVEGGAKLATQLLELNLIDKCILIYSPVFFGDNGLPSITSIDTIQDKWSFSQTRTLGRDLMIELIAR